MQRAYRVTCVWSASSVGRTRGGAEAMNLLQAIGNTPLVELVNINERPGVRILCKLEGCNPGGSVKDRPALSMITKAEERGALDAGQDHPRADVGQHRHRHRHDRRRQGVPRAALHARVREHGAQPDPAGPRRGGVAHPGHEGIDGAIREAHELRRAGARTRTTCRTSTRTRTTSSPTVETTGPEIYEQTAGEVDYFVAGMGTTGTLMGTGRYLKSKKPGVRIVGVEPVDGPRHPGAQEHDRVDGARHLRARRPRRQAHW